MKRVILIACTAFSLFAMAGSSIWEGAAGVAAGGVLPGTGLYIATNSFPLNTVVDVTNLENGQTIRVVTSSALEAAPGLLAVLSRDAAEALGIQGRTLGRIRMTQPPDAVAFSRFGSGRRRPAPGDPASRDPDFDPAAFAALHGIYPFTGAAGEDAIIDLHDAETLLAPVPAAPLAAQDSDAEAEAQAAEVEQTGAEQIAEAGTHAAEAYQAEADQAEALAAAAVAAAAEPEAGEQDIAEAMDEAANERFHQDALSLMRGFFPEPSFEIVDDVFAQDVQGAQGDPQAGVLAYADSQDAEQAAVYGPGFAALAMVPAELRPPAEEAALVPDPYYVIPGIERPPVAAFQDYQPDPSMIIAPIMEAPIAEAPFEEAALEEGLLEETPLEEALLAEEALPAEDPLALLPAAVVTAVPEPAEEPAQEAAAFAPPPVLPLPMISNLQAGKYYLQIAAYSNAEAVRYELSRIDRIDSSLAREVVVFRGVNPEHGTVYQILIGPLNLGESGALLHRFRSTHRDAFIRPGG